MAARGSSLQRKQEEAIVALLTQRNIEEAARTAGIGTRTLMRWLQIPEFQKAYREARRQAFGQAVARLQQGTSAAATTLLKTMIDPNTPASVRVRAAEAIFNHAAPNGDDGAPAAHRLNHLAIRRRKTMSVVDRSARL
jgi:hypothetical protein